ncbi:MAG: isochorismatase family protein [Streptosporangiaceae bacterium]
MTSALLIMDVQQGVVERFGQPGLLDRLGRALAAARNAGIPVIFVRVAFRPGFPRGQPRQPQFHRHRRHCRGSFRREQPGDADPPRARAAPRRAHRGQETGQRLHRQRP